MYVCDGPRLRSRFCCLAAAELLPPPPQKQDVAGVLHLAASCVR